MYQSQFPFTDQYDWQSRTQIGCGGFAKVYKVKHTQNSNYFAVREIQMSKFDEDFKREALKAEIQIMQQLQSQNTLTMYACKIGKNYTYMVVELCDCDLKKVLNKSLYLQQKQAVNVLADVVNGYQALAQKNYIHRDMKPQNILIKKKVYKLADYGFTKKIKNSTQKLRQICGTRIYMAPQIMYSKQYTSKCDVWSLGLIMYEMLFGFLPWPTRYIDSYKEAVVSREVAFPYNCGIGANTKNFIQRCLQLEQQNRISWDDIFLHPLIRKKDIGLPIIHRKVSEDLRKVLIKVQQSSQRKSINLKELFKQGENRSYNRESFYQFLVRIDPQITTYESHQIFQAADFSKDGILNFQQFKSFFLQVDYRPIRDIASRQIEQIVKMAQDRKLSLYAFFDIFDQNKSKDIDFQEFQKFIHYVSPRLQIQQIKLMWKKFDKDQSGTISLQQFREEVTRGTVEEQRKIPFKYYERAMRNLQCLKGFLISRTITPAMLISRGGNKKLVSLDDFGSFVRQINYVITRDEIVQMFKIIDKDHSQMISIQELQRFLFN